MEPYIGEIMMFAGPVIPPGWAPCDGRILQIAQYQALYSLLGPSYGIGTSPTSFALPDLRGRAVVGVGTSPVDGQLYPRAGKGGQESVTLLPEQMAVHSHQLAVNGATGTAPGVIGTTLAGAGSSPPNVATPPNIYGSANGPKSPMASNSIALAGGGAPHENMQPFLAVNFYIALQGLYPSKP